MKIHLMADLHIEGGYPKWPDVDADLCVLAGDIGVAAKPRLYKTFLEGIKKNFRHVILVLGNHEFYHGKYEDTLVTMKQMCDELGIHLMDVELDTDNLQLDGVTFWGSTLWTDLKENDWFVRQKAKNSINDFHVIDNFGVQRALDLHLKTVERINWDADVVITHHMPILRKHTRFEIDDITYVFNCTTMEQKIRDSKIKYWLYGHTHDNRGPEDLDGTIVVTNQAGYSGERMGTQYNSKFLIEV